MFKLLRSALLAILSCTLYESASGQTNLTSEGLAAIMRPVRAWPSLDEIEHSNVYSNDDWSNLVEAAKVIQQSDPRSVEKALKDWEIDKIKGLPCDYVTGTKLFLTLRIVFDLPEHAPKSETFSYSDTNRDGTVNLAWPIVWNAGRPRLVTGWDSYEGRVYPFASEFRQFKAKYKLRNLSKYRNN